MMKRLRMNFIGMNGPRVQTFIRSFHSTFSRSCRFGLLDSTPGLSNSSCSLQERQIGKIVCFSARNDSGRRIEKLTVPRCDVARLFVQIGKFKPGSSSHMIWWSPPTSESDIFSKFRQALLENSSYSQAAVAARNRECFLSHLVKKTVTDQLV